MCNLAISNKTACRATSRGDGLSEHWSSLQLLVVPRQWAEVPSEYPLTAAVAHDPGPRCTCRPHHTCTHAPHYYKSHDASL